MFKRSDWLLVAIATLLAACATSSHTSEPRTVSSGRAVTVQCTVTDTSTATPCQNEARRACNSDRVRFQQVASKNTIPATQGVDQTPMPITDYAVSYTCND